MLTVLIIIAAFLGLIFVTLALTFWLLLTKYPRATRNEEDAPVIAFPEIKK